jgi:hypothetical protein
MGCLFRPKAPTAQEGNWNMMKEGMLSSSCSASTVLKSARTGADLNVTFPSRQYSVNGGRRSFALLP